jgi:transcriptional regulator with PAS, ATPase and Fis domain
MLHERIKLELVDERRIGARAGLGQCALGLDSLLEGECRVGAAQVIGRSEPWRGVLRRALQVAPTRATVLLQGESGTGKEIVARLIHHACPPAGAPFIAINCAALPDTLLESELFGYERGAFTGAQAAKPGQIELAWGGVLFLDEVSELTPVAQAKFLRVLQEREFQRLGGTRLLKANVRVIAATNRDLRDAVERGAFREDLYYRLQVFDIRIPPLRERADDIPLLAKAALQDVARSIGRAPAVLTHAAIAVLVAHTWPGNVRQLRNVLERAAILCDGDPINPSHLELPVESPRPPASASTIGTPDLRTLERGIIERVLRETEWNKSKAASRLGLSRSQLYVRLRRHALLAPIAS